MKLFTNTITVISAHYNEQDKYTLVSFNLKKQNGKYTIVQSLLKIEDCITKNAFMILYVTGYGIISKKIGAINEEYLNKITKEDKEFYWSYSGYGNEKKLNFVRQSQVSELLEELQKAKLIVCDQFYSAEKEPPKEEAILNIANEFFNSRMNVRDILKSGEQNSKIALLFYKKLRFFVLVAVLFTLIINIFASQSISEKYSLINVQLENARNNAGKENSAEQQKKALFKDFDKKIPWKYSWLCDRIASDVPEQITLLNLSVQKQIKSPENNKTPELKENTVTISGSSNNPDSISAFMSVLQKEPFTKELTLLSVKQGKAQGLLSFIMEIKL